MRRAWEWVGNTTNYPARPPSDDQPCKCGRYTWGEFDRLCRKAELSAIERLIDREAKELTL